MLHILIMCHRRLIWLFKNFSMPVSILRILSYYPPKRLKSNTSVRGKTWCRKYGAHNQYVWNVFVFQFITAEPTDSKYSVLQLRPSREREPLPVKCTRQPFGEKNVVMFFLSFYFSRLANVFLLFSNTHSLSHFSLYMTFSISSFAFLS